MHIIATFTIIGYKPLCDMNFARCTGVCQLHALFPAHWGIDISYST